MKISNLLALSVTLSLPLLFGFQNQAQPTDRVNADAALISDFTKRVNEYVKIHKKALSAVHTLKPTDSPEAISRHEKELAHQIQEAREDAKPGDIFSPEIADVFRRLLIVSTKGTNGAKVQQSLRRAEPVKVELRVNRAYPAGVPLQSTPPTLLANLPPLPKEVEYRIVGPNLILHDVEANIIVDFVLNAMP